MSSDAKQKMIRSAMVMLATKGLQGTSFSEVLAHSGAPRGSVYHHFPGGKAQLVDEALQFASQGALRALEQAGPSASDLTAAFLGMWRTLLVKSKFEAGCSVLAVAIAADSAELRGRTAQIFQKW